MAAKATLPLTGNGSKSCISINYYWAHGSAEIVEQSREGEEKPDALGLKGWWLMAILKSEQLQKVFHNTLGRAMGILSDPPVLGRNNHSYQPWQTVHLNWHYLIHSHLSTVVAYKGKSSKQGVNTTEQFPMRNKTRGGGQACGCARLPSLVWGAPGNGKEEGVEGGCHQD